MLVTLRTADMAATSLTNEREQHARTPPARYKRSSGPYARHNREEGLTPHGLSSLDPRIQACSSHRDSGRVPCYQNSTRPKITVHYTPPFLVRRPREPRESNSTTTIID